MPGYVLNLHVVGASMTNCYALFMLIVLPSSECPLGNQCDSTNGRCILVNNAEVYTCILGYELQSDGTTCLGKNLVTCS